MNADIHPCIEGVLNGPGGRLDLAVDLALELILSRAPPEARIKRVAWYETRPRELIEGNPGLKKALESAVVWGDYRDVIALPILREDEPYDPALEATFKAFAHPYVDGFQKALLAIVDKYHGKGGYNNMISIVQSSGMAKSRGIDEAARSRFTFLFNLRPRVAHDMYPPPDECVREIPCV